MSSKESHRERRTARTRSRPGRAVEGLEPRRLMAYSAFGYSLPALTVSGYAPTTAAYGSPLTIDVNVLNTGASSLVEPTNLPPGYIGTPDTQGSSTANSPATTVEVFASTTPNAKSGGVLIDTVNIPPISQNSNYETISTLPFPARPAGFPGNGGKIYLTYVVNNEGTFTEASLANNIYHVPNPITVTTSALPDLQVVAFNVPSTLQPGDVIAPTIRIANFGTADPAAQGPVTVDIVASLNKTFGPGDAVVASYVIDSIPGSTGVPTYGSIADEANVIPPPNQNTTMVAPFKLPTTPGFYYLGVIIDPFHTINQSYAPSPNLIDPVPVGPPSQFLPPGTLLFTTEGQVPVFPAAPVTVVNPISTTPTNPTTPVFIRPPLFPRSNNPIVTLDAVGHASTKVAHGKTAHVASVARPAKVSHPRAKH